MGELTLGRRSVSDRMARVHYKDMRSRQEIGFETRDQRSATKPATMYAKYIPLRYLCCNARYQEKATGCQVKD